MKQTPSGKFGTAGKPDVTAPAAPPSGDSIFGQMSGKAKIVGDILSPITPLEDWDALKDPVTDSSASPVRSVPSRRST